MPRIRPRIVVDEEYEEQSSYTIDLDLPESGLVSDLYLILHARRAAGTTGGNAIARNLISSMSVNQAGQDSLNAAPPDFFQADYYYKTGKFPQIHTRRWETTDDIEEVIPILFGNKEKDLQYYVDLAKLNDPKLSVTYNLASTDNEAGCPWLSTYYPRFSVLANLIEGPDIPASLGYHSLRQIEKYTASNSQIKKIELKGGRPIKRILFQYDLTNIAYVMRQHIDKIRLWGDNEAWVPLSMKTERFKNFVKMVHGVCEVRGNFERWYGGRTINNIVDERDYVAIMMHNTKLLASYPYGGSGHGFVLEVTTMTTGGADVTTTMNGFFEFAGIAPWAIYPISMPEMLGLDYLDPELHKPVYFELEHASNATTTGGDTRVAVSDLTRQ